MQRGVALPCDGSLQRPCHCRWGRHAGGAGATGTHHTAMNMSHALAAGLALAAVFTCPH